MRKLALILLIFGAALAGIVTPVLTQDEMSDEQTFVEGLIADLLSSQGRTLRVRDVSIGLTGNVTVGRIEVHDGDGAWLGLDSVALDWQPFSLLSETLTVNELRAAQVSLLRLPLQAPEGEAPEEAEDLGGVVVERLAIDDLSIGAGVLGREVRLAADGAMRVTGDPRIVSIKLSARHTDGTSGALDAAVDYDQTSGALKIDIVADEAAGGILSALLPLSDQADISFRIAGDGPIDNWTGDLRFSVDDEAIVTGRARILGDGDGHVASLDVEGALHELTADGFDDLFAGRSVLAVRTRVAPGGVLSLERAAFTSQTIAITASGTIDAAGSETDVTVEARTVGADPVSVRWDTSRWSAVALTDAAVTARLTGVIGRPDWTIEARASNVSYADARIASLRIDGTGTGLTPSDDLATEFAVALQGTVAPETAGAIPPVFEGAVEASLDGTWSASEIAIAAFKVDAQRYDLDASGSYATEDGAFALDVDLTGDTLETGNATADLILRGPVRLAGNVSGSGVDKIAFENVAFTSQALEARVDGTYDDSGDSALTADVTIADLQRVNDAMRGRLVLEATLDGPFEALNVAFTGTGENVVIAGRALRDLDLAVTGTVRDAVPDLDVVLDAAQADEPLRLTARITGDDDLAVRLHDIDGRLGAAAITGNIGLTHDGLPEGTVSLNVANLSDFADPAMQGLRGSLDAEIVLTAADGRSDADIRIAGNDLARDDLRVARLTARAKALDVLGDVEISASGLLQETAVGDAELSDLAIDVSATHEEAYRITLREPDGDWTVRAQVALGTEGDVTVVHIDAMNGTLGGIDVALARATALRIGADTVTIDRTELVTGDGRLVLEGAVSPALALRADLDRLSLGIVNAIVPDLGLSGSVSGTVTAAGDPAAPRVDIALNASGVSNAELRAQGIPPVAIDMKGTMRDRVLAVDGRIRDGAVTLAVTGDVDLNGPGRLDLAVAGDLPSGVVARITAENGIVASGSARVDLRVRGPLDDIAYAGTVTTSGATFGDVEGRITVRDVTARLVIDGDVVRVEQFSGTTAGGDGRVSLAGTIGLGDGAPVRLDINVKRGRYTDGTLLVTLFDAALTLRGSLDGALTLAGTIDLIKPKVTLSELPPSSLPPIAVDHRRASARVRRQEQALERSRGRSGASNLFIDAELRVVDRIAVTGRGINAELKGALRLAGPIAEPQAYGGFRLIKGSVEVLNTKIPFNTGEFNFVGNLNPNVRFVGTVRTPGAVITLAISGPADAPEITITSVPDLPQEEALALLIFGRSTTELSPIQIAQLAGSIALLSGGSGGGLAESLQDMLGGTTIEVVRTEEGETAVNVGRQITDQLSVGVQQETGTGERRVIIDLDVTRNIILRGTVGEDRSTSTGIFFEKEY